MVKLIFSSPQQGWIDIPCLSPLLPPYGMVKLIFHILTLPYPFPTPSRPRFLQNGLIDFSPCIPTKCTNGVNLKKLHTNLHMIFNNNLSKRSWK